MSLLLDHRETGRNPVVLTGLAASAAIALTTDLSAIPLGVWAVWVPCTLALLFVFFINPVAGTRITKDVWQCYTSDGRCAIPLGCIDHVQMTDWHDGRATCRIHLTDQRILTVPSDCMPRPKRLIDALTAAGIRIETR